MNKKLLIAIVILNLLMTGVCCFSIMYYRETIGRIVE